MALPSDAVDLTPRLVGEVEPAGSAQRWASSGGMWLTGRAAGEPLGAPAGIVGVLDAAAEQLGTSTATVGDAVAVDGPALLGERAALTGLRRRGDVSCGGSTRLLPTADGWVAVALPRPDDLELLPAWIGVVADHDPWADVAATVATRPTVQLLDDAAELGLAVGALGERSEDRRAVIATASAAAPPAMTLRGVRVVDLSSLWAGPLCGQLLALAGMDVIKVESARRIDGARRGPAEFFDLLNAAKASVLLDLDTRAGLEALHALVRAADVVLESSRPRALAQLGIEADAITSAGHVRVWLSITAHGRRSPHDARAGFGDDTAVAGGLVAIEGGLPLFCADAIADPATGLLAATAVVDRLLAGCCWLVDIALARVSALMACGQTLSWEGDVTPPHARPVGGRAAPLGRDTAAVLDAIHRPP
jgi:hypothetical protein